MTKEFHDILNPKLWINNKLKPEVASKLKDIANAFIESLEVPREAIRDVVITGSSASYNYTPHSDIDLHLIVDFDKVHKDCPIVGDFLLSKKSEFNNNHDIFIYGIPVEVYAEATDNENVHNGLFSLKDNKWIDEPKKLKPVDNDVAVNAKYKELSSAIKDVADKEEATQLMDKIKRMRKAGLAKEGEFSVENLVFKKLRDEGLIGKLADTKKEGIDKELSLEESYEVIIDTLGEMLGTSTAMMAPYANPVVGQENPSKYEKQGRKRQKKAVLGYKYKKTWGKKDMNIEETMLEIADVCESTLQAILKSDLPSEKKSELRKKLVNARQKELDLADKKAYYDWVTGKRKHSNVSVARGAEYTKNANGERKTRLRSDSNNYDKYGNSSGKTESQKISASIKRHEKKYNKNEALMEEIISICENILDQERKRRERRALLAKAAASALPKREAEAENIQKDISKVPQVVSDTSKAELIAKKNKADKRVNQAKEILGFKPNAK